MLSILPTFTSPPFVQIIALLAEFDLNWPPLFTQIIAMTSAVNFNLEVRAIVLVSAI